MTIISSSKKGDMVLMDIAEQLSLVIYGKPFTSGPNGILGRSQVVRWSKTLYGKSITVIMPPVEKGEFGRHREQIMSMIEHANKEYLVKINVEKL